MAQRLLNKHTDLMPDDAVSIMRPSTAGNPYVIGRDGTRDQVCDAFDIYFKRNVALRDWCDRNLRGHDLVCCCAPKRCHGETILRYLRGESRPRSNLWTRTP